MFSIHKKSILLAGGYALASVSGLGCACCARPSHPVVVKTTAPVADQPRADEATALRGWQKSNAFYHSGATQGWPTRWYYSPNPDYTTPVNYVADPLMFIAQSASLPATLVLEPPFHKPVIYAGDVLPPSYNAMPPLPPEQPVSRYNPDPDPLSRPQRPVAPSLPPVPEEHPPLYVPPAPRPAAKPAMKAAPAPSTHGAVPTTRPSR